MAETEDSVLAGYEVLLCVTGGIACYKSVDLASKLVQAEAGTTVAMTESAKRFVCPLTFQAITQRRVYESLWQRTEDFSYQHISLTEAADLMIVAPATANIIAKFASGIADDLVSTLGLSTSGACPILIAPAMNARMWNSPAVHANMERLETWSFHIVGPVEGHLACGTVGPGRMAEPDDIFAAVIKLLRQKPPKQPRQQ